MSRQFDEYMEGRFDLYGEEYSLIEPDNADDLVKAFEVKSALQTYISGLMHDEDSSGWCDLLQQQEDNIKEYVDSLGDFDNSTLSNNIIFLVKKNGMRVGELEDMLGISAGYISRTVKEDSKKKMSVDIVWKISRLFDTDIRTLTESQMWVSHSNTDLLVKFLQRLYQDTKDNFFSWENDGGVMVVLNERYEKMGLVTTEEDETAVYHPNHMNQALKWVLYKDIVSLECFEGKKDLVIIPFMAEGKEKLLGYDFLFVWDNDGQWCWEKVFYTNDDPFGSLHENADKLYRYIEDMEYDAKLDPNIHQLISSYVKGGRPE